MVIRPACERLLVERHPKQSIIFRPGLIAGKWDYTGRFTYWCRRFLRGGRVLAPEPASRFIQFIDAADIARFAERALASNIVGIFNVVGPPHRRRCAGCSMNARCSRRNSVHSRNNRMGFPRLPSAACRAGVVRAAALVG